MGITPEFGRGTVAAAVAKFQENLDKAVIFLLKYLGEELAKYAKDNHTYTDQTGNLTNSIGYAVVKGKQILSFESGHQSEVAANAALATAMQMVDQTSSNYSLIIVAGMNYAAYVESKGYNVILPAEMRAKTEFPAAMQKLVQKAQNKANDLFGNII